MKLPTTAGLFLLVSLAVAAQVETRDEGSQIDDKVHKFTKVGRDVENSVVDVDVGDINVEGVELEKRKGGGGGGRGSSGSGGVSNFAISYGALAAAAGAAVIAL